MVSLLILAAHRELFGFGFGWRRRESKAEWGWEVANGKVDGGVVVVVVSFGFRSLNRNSRDCDKVAMEELVF